MTNDQLYERAMLIQEGKANGCWLPIIWALANRRHSNAMLELASWLSDQGKFAQANRLYRQAFRQGSANAAQNLAMNHFNVNDLCGYRHWMARAARGDPHFGQELKRFDTRLPHDRAFNIRRGRPTYPNEGFGTRRPISA